MNKYFKNIVFTFVAACLVFSLIGATNRPAETVGPELSKALSPSYEEPVESATEEQALEPAVVTPRTIEIPEVEETGSFTAPAKSCYCNRAYAGFYRYYSGELYVCAQDVFSALLPSARFDEQDGVLSVEAGDIHLTAESGRDYFICNDRYLYAPAGVIKADDGMYLPAEGVARCFGGTLELDKENERLDIIANRITPLEDGDDYYDEDDVYWMSHIIFAEAGSESFTGMIAVGNVVMNRIASTYFRETTVKDTIFSEGQFDPVANGSINLTPSASAEAAARVALEGYEVVSEDTLFFATFQFPGAFICTAWIGNHCFMALA